MHSYSKTKLKKDLRIAFIILAVVVLITVGFIFIIRMEPQIIDKNAVSGEPADQESITGFAAYEAASLGFDFF